MSYSPGGLGIVHDRLLIGTHPSYNATTFTNPASAAGVENSQGFVEIHTATDRVLHYYMWLPKDVGYSTLGEDAPTIPTPYAGSPGAVQVWAQDLSVSQNYFSVQCTAVWALRGRF